MAEDREEGRTHVWWAGFDGSGHFYTTSYSFQLFELNLDVGSGWLAGRGHTEECRGSTLRGCDVNVQLINVLSEQQMLEPRDERCRRPVAVELSKPWISEATV